MVLVCGLVEIYSYKCIVFIFEVLNFQLYEYGIGIYGLIVELEKNGILVELVKYALRVWCDFKFYYLE